MRGEKDTRGPTSQPPRTPGGVVVYAAALVGFVALLSAPVVVTAAAAGAISALVLDRLRRNGGDGSETVTRGSLLRRR